MFQAAKIEENMENLLIQELDYFKSIQQISKKVVEQAKTMPVNLLSQMVSYRQEWIDKIQKLENKRKKIADRKPTEKEMEYLKAISEIAQDLVQLDNEINETLQKRKMEYLKKLSSSVGDGRYALKQARNEKGNSNLLDIVQE